MPRLPCDLVKPCAVAILKFSNLVLLSTEQTIGDDLVCGQLQMASYFDLFEKVFADASACQDETTPEFKFRAVGNYSPLGAFLGRGYRITDAALDAVCEIADRFRTNDKTIELTVTRDQWRLTVSNAIGVNLDTLMHEADPRKRWSMIRDELKEIAGNVGVDLVHYTPVWLFVGQEIEPFSTGPVRFFREVLGPMRSALASVRSRSGKSR